MKYIILSLCFVLLLLPLVYAQTWEQDSDKFPGAVDPEIATYTGVYGFICVGGDASTETASSVRILEKNSTGGTTNKLAQNADGSYVNYNDQCLLGQAVMTKYRCVETEGQVFVEKAAIQGSADKECTSGNVLQDKQPSGPQELSRERFTCADSDIVNNDGFQPDISGSVSTADIVRKQDGPKVYEEFEWGKPQEDLCAGSVIKNLKTYLFNRQIQNSPLLEYVCEDKKAVSKKAVCEFGCVDESGGDRCLTELELLEACTYSKTESGESISNPLCKKVKTPVESDQTIINRAPERGICTDSDGGQNTETYGEATITVSGSLYSKNDDYCYTSKTLLEMYCDENNIRVSSVKCEDLGENFQCSDGACKTGTRTAYRPKSGPWVLTSTKPVDIEAGNIVSCRASQENNPGIAGTALFTYLENGQQTSQEFQDECVDSKYLNKYACNEKNNLLLSSIECERGCQDGACQQEQETVVEPNLCVTAEGETLSPPPCLGLNNGTDCVIYTFSIGDSHRTSEEIGTCTENPAGNCVCQRKSPPKTELLSPYRCGNGVVESLSYREVTKKNFIGQSYDDLEIIEGGEECDPPGRKEVLNGNTTRRICGENCRWEGTIEQPSGSSTGTGIGQAPTEQPEQASAQSSIEDGSWVDIIFKTLNFLSSTTLTNQILGVRMPAYGYNQAEEDEKPIIQPLTSFMLTFNVQWLVDRFFEGVDTETDEGQEALANMFIVSCNDSDGGINKNTFGFVTVSVFNGRMFINKDTCSIADVHGYEDVPVLKEQYCIGKVFKESAIICDCIDGICKKPGQEYTCFDTDSAKPGTMVKNLNSGINPEVKGAVGVVDKFSGEKITETEDNCNIFGNLDEGYCDNYDIPTFTTVKCKFGCAMGACIPTGCEHEGKKFPIGATKCKNYFSYDECQPYGLWSYVGSCDENTYCVEDSCKPACYDSSVDSSGPSKVVPIGTTRCGYGVTYKNEVYTCTEDGWKSKECKSRERCKDGVCISVVSNS